MGKPDPTPITNTGLKHPTPITNTRLTLHVKAQGLVPRRIYIPAAFLFAVPYHVQLNQKWLKNIRA